MHCLNQFNLIEMKIGWRDKTGRSFATRIWAAKELIKLFKEAKFGIQDIYQHKDKETIILRDSNKKDLEYDDTEKTKKLRKTNVFAVKTKTLEKQMFLQAGAVKHNKKNKENKKTYFGTFWIRVGPSPPL